MSIEFLEVFQNTPLNTEKGDGFLRHFVGLSTMALTYRLGGFVCWLLVGVPLLSCPHSVSSVKRDDKLLVTLDPTQYLTQTKYSEHIFLNEFNDLRVNGG